MFSAEDHNRKIKHQIDYRLAQIPEEYYNSWKKKTTDELSDLSDKILMSLSREHILDEDKAHMKQLLEWVITMIDSRMEDAPSRDVFTRR